MCCAVQQPRATRCGHGEQHHRSQHQRGGAPRALHAARPGNQAADLQRRRQRAARRRRGSPRQQALLFQGRRHRSCKGLASSCRPVCSLHGGGDRRVGPRAASLGGRAELCSSDAPSRNTRQARSKAPQVRAGQQGVDDVRAGTVAREPAAPAPAAAPRLPRLPTCCCCCCGADALWTMVTGVPARKKRAWRAVGGAWVRWQTLEGGPEAQHYLPLEDAACAGQALARMRRCRKAGARSVERSDALAWRLRGGTRLAAAPMPGQAPLPRLQEVT